MFAHHAAVVLVCAGLLGSCRAQEPEDRRSNSETNDPREAESVVLSVEDESYTQADFSSYLAKTVGDEAPELSEAVLSRLYDSFVEERLLLAEAWDWVDQLDPADRESLVAQGGGRLPEDRQLIEIWARILTKDITVAPEEVSDYYEMHKRDFLKPARVRVSQILLSTEDKAVQALDMIKESDESRFREVARQMSIGVEADKGGAMGVFELGQLPTEMETVIFALQEGDISRIVESAYGYHLFRLDASYPPELVPEEESAPEIEAKILEGKLQVQLSSHLVALKQRLDWTMETQNLAFTYLRNGHE
ncbi:MAG: peptidylprolyl isomerase [Candidatus Aminicenantaceae bacterium]